MSIASKTAIIRFVRVLGYGALSAVALSVLSDISAINDPMVTPLIPAITALLTAIDKYAREKRAGL